MKNFTFKMPTRIIYGEGTAFNIKGILSSYGISKVMIVTGERMVETPEFNSFRKRLETDEIDYILFSEAKPDPPIEAVDEAADLLRKSGADGLIAVGGGSSIDTSKAMAMLAVNEGSIRDYLFGGTKSVTKKSLPLIAIPTTAGSGSEVTASSVITDNQNDIKLSVTSDYIIPEAAIIDPLMQTGMPPMITASTGMDALTHAIEAYVSLNAELVSDTFAEKAITLIGENIRTATYNPQNLTARSNMALASTLAAAAFVNGGLGAVHGIAQSMGGVAHTPHGIANALLLPYVMELNIKGAPEKYAKIAKLLGEKTEGLSVHDAAALSIKAVKQMVSDLRIPDKLGKLQIAVTQDMFPDIVKGTMEYRLLAVNPVKVREEDVYKILNDAL